MRNIKDAVSNIKDSQVLTKVNELLKTKGFTDLDDFLDKNLNEKEKLEINAILRI